MEGLRKMRTPLRSSFTKAANHVEELLKSEVNFDELSISFSLLSEKWTKLDDNDRQIIDIMINDSNITEEILTLEYEAISNYADRYTLLKTKIEIIRENQRCNNTSFEENSAKRKVKLPKVELKKFNGDIKEWLGFWSMFKKIHEDPELADEDKFCYLIQSTAEKSRARDLVASFPPTADNYPLVIECLKTRFGKDELLIEVYVRELLGLVLNHNKNNLLNLYDKVEAYLRALETLGVTQDKYAAMLYPLVESCLPEDALRIWERNVSSLTAGCGDDKQVNKLNALMNFLRVEVEGEQRVAIAKTTFGLENESRKKQPKRQIENNFETPTAAGLLNSVNNKDYKKISNCIFCEKRHASQECNKAKRMNVDEKRQIVKRSGCCFLCLKKGHISKLCTSKVKCILCNKLHCSIMCPNVSLDSKLDTLKIEEKNCDQPKEQTLTSQSGSTNVVLQTLQVFLRNENTRHVIRALIDSGSQHSYISTKAVKALKYESLGHIPVIHSLFGGYESPRQTHRRFKIHLTSLDGNYSCNFEALEHGKICGDIMRTPRGPWIKELVNQGINLTDAVNRTHSTDIEPDIQLLIGADVAGKLLNGRVLQLSSGLVAVGTHLGWTLMGKIPQVSHISESCLSIISLFTRDINIPDLWNLDRIGITDSVENQTTVELHQAAYDHFRRSLKINNEGRYEVSLPWLQQHPALPEAKELAEKRLQTTIKKLRSANILEAYQEVLQSWLKEGIIEEVKPEDAIKPGHFLPHRAVVKNSATTKIRPVFDASAHTKNSFSLNQCLAKGPNLLELIPAILTRFRLRKFAVTADIRQAFLQISVDERDRNFLKFLWLLDGDQEKMKIYRHCRVVFGLTSSPFLLSATLAYHLDNAPFSFEDTARILKDSFYVDNCLVSLDSVAECEKFISESRKLLLSGKFDLRDWRRSYFTSTADLENSTAIDSECRDNTNDIISVLGLSWNLPTDELFCSSNHLDVLDSSSQITKRKILSIAQQIFDPLGFLCAFTLLPKLLLQECWKRKIAWDQELPSEITKKFLNWTKQLSLLKDVKVPRWMIKSFPHIDRCSLHVFADASRFAYASCIFIRVESHEVASCQFVRAKNRISPLKAVTIPRLELLACLIAARLADSVKRDMKMQDIKTLYYTDSTNALSWIKREEQWATFVSNRVKEIRSLSDPNDWYHVPGSFNPADMPSRGCSIRHLVDSGWLQGPDWLKSPRNQWPKAQFTVDEECLNQERKKTVIINTEREEPWNCSRFSSYLKIIRTIAWMKRFTNNAKKPESDRYLSALTADELEKAELILLRLIQSEIFGSLTNPVLKSLQPKMDSDGLIRTTTRLVQREDTDSFKHPIVLPSKHPVTRLLILEQHRSLSHAGVHTLMAQLREKYWILQCRRTVKQAIKGCRNCSRFNVAKAEVLPAPLPENRIKNAAVFEITGIDLGGPLYLRTGEKAWFVLFTCAVIRAVHIELVQSLNTDTFLLAFRRFIARRGRPLVVYSDNGTNLVGSNKALQSIDWKRVEEMSSTKRIQWIFIPPTAAWWGGWWERLIGMVKNILRRVLGKARLTHDELVTVLCEAESILNHRPLTYLSEDIEDLQPLTPSLFIQEVKDSCIPDLEVLDSCSLNKRFRYRQKLKEDLRKRFRTEYLGQLKHYSSVKRPTTLQVGQIVLVGSDNIKRLEWPLARILELYTGKDGNTRVARLKTMTGEILRPYQRLYPFEVEDEKRSLFTEISPTKRATGKHQPVADDVRASFPPEPQDLTQDQTPNVEITTKRGRVVKPLKRLDL